MKDSDCAGLLVLKAASRGWIVAHEASGLKVQGQPLRLKRHAARMRDELAATGVDFTRASKELTRDPAARKLILDVMNKWEGLATRNYDPHSGERYRAR